MKTQRRSALKKMFASFAGIAGMGLLTKANSNISLSKEAGNITSSQRLPMFSGHTKFGDLIFIAGKGAHFTLFDIKNRTEIHIPPRAGQTRNEYCLQTGL